MIDKETIELAEIILGYEWSIDDLGISEVAYDNDGPRNGFYAHWVILKPDVSERGLSHLEEAKMRQYSRKLKTDLIVAGLATKVQTSIVRSDREAALVDYLKRNQVVYDKYVRPLVESNMILR